MKETAEVTRDPVSPAPADIPPGNRRVRLWLLFAAHVTLGLFFSIWSAVEGAIPFVLMFLLAIPVFGLVFAQSSLMGLWVAFSSTRWWMRLGSMVVGIIYLEFLVGLGGTGEEFTGLAAMATGGIAVVFGVIRWRYAEIRQLPQESPQPRQEGLKFSIWGLMLFTFLVAVTIAGVKALRESIAGTPTLFVISIWSLCVVVTGLASVWAGLSLARPTLRIVVALPISAALGALIVYAIEQADWETYFYIISIMLLQAGVLIASLLIVRSCGYRLVRRSASEAERLEAERGQE